MCQELTVITEKHERMLYMSGSLKIAAIALAGFLAGCTTTGTSTGKPSEQAVATSIMDAMNGGLIGGTLGAKLNGHDRRKGLEAEYRALEYAAAGQSVSWGESSGISGTVVAASPYRVGSQDCRQYVHTIQDRGGSQSARGTACRNPDGSWTPLI